MQSNKNMRLRDEKGRFLPLGNLNDTAHQLEVLPPKQPQPTANGVKKVIVISGIIGMLYLAYKAIQMIDIKESIKLKIGKFSNVHKIGKLVPSGIAFTLEVILINITKSSMSMSYPFVTLELRKNSTKGGGVAAQVVEITSSKVKNETVDINDNSEMSLSFDFEIYFSTLGQAAALVPKPLKFFNDIFDEMLNPSGKDGQSDFTAIMAGTGVSMWSKTEIYANGIKIPPIEEKLF